MPNETNLALWSSLLRCLVLFLLFFHLLNFLLNETDERVAASLEFLHTEEEGGA